MNKKAKRIASMLLVTTICFLISIISATTAYAVSTITGDVDSDGSVTTKDALLTLRYVAKLENLSGEQLTLADYDKNSIIDMEDARAILKYATLGEGFEDGLYKAGFPASYVEMLVELHKQYPNWQFVPFKTELNWADAVEGEHTPHNKQLIEKSVAANLKCD